MSTHYPGLPSVARHFWSQYLSAVIAMTTMLVFTGAAGAVALLYLAPSGIYFFLLGVVSLILHSAALFVKDVWKGEYEPNQTTFASATALLSVIVILGVFLSTILLIGTAGSLLISGLLDMPTIVAAGVAAYYPVADLSLMRREITTPGALVFLGVVVVINAVFDIHRSVVESLPVIRRARRPRT